MDLDDFSRPLKQEEEYAFTLIQIVGTILKICNKNNVPKEERKEKYKFLTGGEYVKLESAISRFMKQQKLSDYPSKRCPLCNFFILLIILKLRNELFG